ncbi:MAG: hypothetical protein QW186_06820 [Candidatus Bathyarchaeia archaeon]
MVEGVMKVLLQLLALVSLVFLLLITALSLSLILTAGSLLWLILLALSSKKVIAVFLIAVGSLLIVFGLLALLH